MRHVLERTCQEARRGRLDEFAEGKPASAEARKHLKECTGCQIFSEALRRADHDWKNLGSDYGEDSDENRTLANKLASWMILTVCFLREKGSQALVKRSLVYLEEAILEALGRGAGKILSCFPEVLLGQAVRDAILKEKDRVERGRQLLEGPPAGSAADDVRQYWEGISKKAREGT